MLKAQKILLYKKRRYINEKHKEDHCNWRLGDGIDAGERIRNGVRKWGTLQPW